MAKTDRCVGLVKLSHESSTTQVMISLYMLDFIVLKMPHSSMIPLEQLLDMVSRR
jgi:hypothetical protein